MIERNQRAPDYSGALAHHEAEEREKREARETLWAFLWILLAFKVFTLAILFIYTDSAELRHLIGATSWPWLLIPGFAIAGPVGYRWRLLRLRRKRERLRKSEWVIEEPTAAR
jgi:hypothetical protein